MVLALVVYDGSGAARTMGESVTEGLSEASTILEPQLLHVDKATSRHVDRSQAVLVGSKSHLGAADWRISRFLATCQDERVPCSEKIGAAFAYDDCSVGGGAEMTVVGLLRCLLGLDMLVVSHDHYGVAALAHPRYEAADPEEIARKNILAGDMTHRGALRASWLLGYTVGSLVVTMARATNLA